MPYEKIYDLLVIGGGINGAGIACDAAGRGLSVMLCEQDDLGSGTSSSSTKLIHGGLRYLEYGHFGLVRKALNEREVLLRKAPHLIGPLRFIMPYIPQKRPRWVLSLGLFIYDHLGKRRLLPKSRSVRLKDSPLIPSLNYGFEFSDCWVDDARLVIANAQAAHSLGASIVTHHKVERLSFDHGYWVAELFDSQRSKRHSVRSKGIINATGPWISSFITHHTPIISRYQTRLVQGSHIIVPRQFAGDKAYLIQYTDKRIVFVIPYDNDFHLIGTTEVDYLGDPASVHITDAEQAYILNCYNQYFKNPISENDIVATYSGVRPLISSEGSTITQLSRDYEIEINEFEGRPEVNVFGGKITTYRELAENTVSQLKDYYLQMGPAWTAHTPLPGGDIPKADFEAFLKSMHKNHEWLAYETCKRYAHLYGTNMDQLIGLAKSYEDLGQHFGADCYEAEVRYLISHEWARSADDILNRRTKLGLVMSREERAALAAWINELMRG